MSDDPQPGEIMRRLDEVSRQLADIGRRMDEREKQAAATYVRQDVYMANRQADQAVAANLSGDLRVLEDKQDRSETQRRAAMRVNVANGIALAGVVIALIALIVNRGSM